MNPEYLKISTRNACPNGKLDKKYDVARKVMGGSWHMPTKEQCEELLNETTLEFKKY